MATTGRSINWRRTHEAKRTGLCTVDLRPQQHPHDTGPTSDGQLCVGFNTDGNTISYAAEKQALEVTWWICRLAAPNAVFRCRACPVAPSHSAA